MVSFTDLKNVITKNCRINDGAKGKTKYSFILDVKNLEKDLQKMDKKLHVISLFENQESFIPNEFDIQLFSEYFYDAKLRKVYDGESEAIRFMIVYLDTEGDAIPSEFTIDPRTFYEKCNGADKEERENSGYDPNFIIKVCRTFPIYNTIVVRSYSGKKDCYWYNVKFRSNHTMVSYYNHLNGNNVAQTTENIGEQKPVDPEEAELHENVDTATE